MKQPRNKRKQKQWLKRAIGIFKVENLFHANISCLLSSTGWPDVSANVVIALLYGIIIRIPDVEI